MKLAFVTNICPHYRVKTFELFASKEDIDFYFFSAGDEWYWQTEQGVNTGNFSYQYISGVKIGKSRINPELAWLLWKNDYDAYIKCINGRFTLPLTYLIARVRRKPFILWTGIWMRLTTMGHKLLFPFTRYIYLHADAIVVYGEHVKRYLISEGVHAKRIFVAGHAVDNQQYNHQISEHEKTLLHAEMNIDKSKRIIIFLGRLEEIKGIEYLISAFSKINRIEDTVLIIGGTGSLEHHLKQKAEELKISENIRFPGYISKEKVIQYFSISTVLALPSITLPTGKETWGLVINEAFNQGLPVITTTAVGAAAGGLVEDGINGFIIPEKDVDALVISLNKVLCDEKLRSYLSSNARKKIKDWDNNHMINGFLDALNYVVSKEERY